MSTDELRGLCCKRCGGIDTARSIETISASCDIAGLDEDGHPDFSGETKVHWDSSTTVGFDCSACLAEAEELPDLFELVEALGDAPDDRAGHGSARRPTCHPASAAPTAEPRSARRSTVADSTTIDPQTMPLP